jgi:hypothetical protein
MTERLFDLVGIDDVDEAERKLDGFRRWGLAILAFEGIIALRYAPYASIPFAQGLLAVGFFVCLGLGWRRRFARPALALALLLELCMVVVAFPDNANHQYLSLVCLTLLLLVGPGDASRSASLVGPGDASGSPSAPASDAIVCLQSIRWIVLGGFFWAGVAKILSGYWLDGGFLTWRAAIDPGFERVFAWLIPEAELARLTALENRPGAGPFRVDAPLLVVVSNLTWIAELVLPVGLLFQATRRAAVAASLGVLAAIQLGAHEVFFAGWMLAGFLLFLDRDRLSPLLPALALGYAAYGWATW